MKNENYIAFTALKECIFILITPELYFLVRGQKSGR